ncbi:MAG: M23 family metallopeptidase [Acidimicrobiia bacterium]
MRLRVLVAVAVAMAVAAPAYAQGGSEITQADVDRAREARSEAAASLAEATAEFEQAVADEEIAREKIAALARTISALELDIADRKVEVGELVRSRYMSGGPTGTERLFSAATFDQLPVQGEYYALVGEMDLITLRGLEAAEAHHRDQQALLDATLADQTALVESITSLRDDILAALEQADLAYNKVAVAFAEQEERKRREEEERRKREEAARAAAAAAEAPAATSTTASPNTTRTPPTTVATTTTAEATTTTTQGSTTTTTPPSAPPPVVTDGKTCPVNAATSFSDSWGARRSGGRTHKGVDMMAVRNAPLVAIETGVITRTSSSSLGGISIYLTGDSGSRYYYAHLESLADGVQKGLAVSAGDTIGFNGSSGNAPDWLPHLHFQYAPPASDWVNPYPLVRELC